MNRLYKIVRNFGRPDFVDDQWDDTLIRQTDVYVAKLRNRKDRVKKMVTINKLARKYFSATNPRTRKRIEKEINAQQ